MICMPKMLPFEQVTAVIQGGYCCEVTERVVDSVRENLPGAQIIFSTCDREVPETLKGCDHIIVSEDPGGYIYEDRPFEKENNINRQIVNTLAGLREVQTPYTLKIRSDFLLTGNSFLEYYDRYPRIDEAWRVFKHKVLSCCYYARNPRSAIPYPLHPSDLVFFGRTEDLLKLFDIPLMTHEQAYWNVKDIMQYQYVPEQYIFINCLLKGGHPFDCRFYNDCRPVNIEQTERYFASNFIFLDFEQFNLLPTKSDFCLHTHPKAFQSCYTHIEWMRLYRDNVDPQQEVSAVDKEREKIEAAYQRYKKYRFLANLCAFFPGSKRLRRRVRTSVLEFLLK